MNIVTRIYSNDEDYLISNWCCISLKQELIDKIKFVQEKLKELHQLDSSVYKITLFDYNCDLIDCKDKINDEFEELQENHRDSYFFKVDEIEANSVRIDTSALVVYKDSFGYEMYAKYSNTLLYSEELDLNVLLYGNKE